MNKEKTEVCLNNFTKITLLGKGSFGIVYLVEEKKTNKYYAMKVVEKKHVLLKQCEELITIQRNVLARVEHIFIVKMFYAFQDEKKLYFILEYCHGELKNLISKNKKLSEDQSRFYAAQIVIAIEYLHSRNITYRDLKPQNVLIDKKGYVKLTDFGMADMLNQEIVTSRGTFEYLAPQVVNKSLSGKLVDWWCLGNTIFEMVTGIPPFYDQNKEVIKKKILNDQPTFPIYVTNKLRSLLKGLLHKNPQQRLGSQGAKYIKQHPWFSKIDWVKIQNREIQAPYILQPYQQKLQFLSAPSLLQSGQQRKSSCTEYDYYKDFSYAGSRRNSTFSNDEISNQKQLSNTSSDAQFYMDTQQSVSQIVKPSIER